MRYKPEQYAESFVRVYQVADEVLRKELPQRLVTVLKKYGDGGNALRVMREIEKRLTYFQDGMFVQIEYAPSVGDELRATLEQAFGPNDTVTSRDVALLGAGVRVVIDDEYVLDCSMKRKAEKLFSK